MNNFKSTLAAASLVFASSAALASTSTIESFHQVMTHPGNGSDIFVQVDVAQIDDVDVSGYDQFYANASVQEFRSLSSGQHLLKLTCRVSQSATVPSGSGGPDAIFSTVIEAGQDYELYPHVTHVISGPYEWVLCNPGIKKSN
ncbi:hypothetical protein LJ739_10215 [Aestuariibacter halophilus]|uniref:VirK protein n=1 Tax=Fluctibacter halophilus TaxID=226011 RepID=A0ABS8G8X1_9ALTE|nr:hypothetical protein [Aestuariibacter halophilus]MCC2616616.1 hypothetical protein [Aestuariibacter halophilus]